MPVTINPAVLAPILQSTFCGGLVNYTQTLGATWCRLFSGEQPTDPTVITGITAIHTGNVDLPIGKFLAPSSGVTMLASPINFTASVSGVTPTFIRLYSGTAGTGPALMDVPVGLVASDGTAVISSVSFVSGATVSITDLRLKLNTIGSLSVNNAVANYLLGMLVRMPVPNGMANYNNAAGLGAASRYRITTASGEDYLGTVPVRAYSGVVPASANDAATGTLLWTKNLTVDQMFSVSGNGMVLNGAMAANASATGTATYVRVVKAAYTESTWLSSFPECIIQAPVGPPSNGVTFSPSADMVSGVSANMTQFTILLQP